MDGWDRLEKIEKTLGTKDGLLFFLSSTST